MTVANIRAVFIFASRFSSLSSLSGSGDRLDSERKARGIGSEFRVGSHELCAGEREREREGFQVREMFLMCL